MTSAGDAVRWVIKSGTARLHVGARLTRIARTDRDFIVTSRAKARTTTMIKTRFLMMSARSQTSTNGPPKIRETVPAKASTGLLTTAGGMDAWTGSAVNTSEWASCSAIHDLSEQAVTTAERRSLRSPSPPRSQRPPARTCEHRRDRRDRESDR